MYVSYIDREVNRRQVVLLCAGQFSIVAVH